MSPWSVVREAFQAALARSKVGMNEERFLAFRHEVALALADAMTNRRAELQGRAERAGGTLAGIEAAIVARIGSEALHALQNDEDEAPDGVGDPILFQLIEIRRHAALEVDAAHDLLDGTSAPSARRSRKLSGIEEALITGLASAWARHVDPDLPLPRRDPKPTSPLLRFIDAVMAHALGEDRPAPKAVLTFLYDHVRLAKSQGGVSTS